MRYYISLNLNRESYGVTLISIGVVAADGREYHAICNEFNFKDSTKITKETVLRELFQKEVPDFARQYIPIEDFQSKIGKAKSINHIAEEIADFINVTTAICEYGCCKIHLKQPYTDDPELPVMHLSDKLHLITKVFMKDKAEFYGCFSNAEWRWLHSFLFRFKFFDLSDIAVKFTNLKEVFEKKIFHLYYKEQCALDERYKSLKEFFDAMKGSRHYPVKENTYDVLVNANWIKKFHHWMIKFI